MKKIALLLLSSTIALVTQAQPCSTTNGANCVCPDGTNTCDLLPDIMISWFGMEDDAPTEYSQTGNGVEDGRLRITGATPNLGYGAFTVLGTDYFVCGTDTIYDPTRSITTCPGGGYPTNLLKQRIYHRDGNSITYTDRWAGGQTYHPGHHHNHVDDWVVFTLRIEDPNQPDTLQWPVIGTGAKIGFCLMDLSNCNASYGDCRDSHIYGQGNIITSTGVPNFGMGGGSYTCNPVEQGISVGYVDIYSQLLDGMWINIPPNTCNGDYWIVAQVDPRNNFLESNENNNWTAIPYTLTKQTPTSTSAFSLTMSGAPYLCDNDSVVLTATPGTKYEWSTGDTTHSVTIKQPGSYYAHVTNQCGHAYSDTVTITSVSPVTAVVLGDTSCLGSPATLSANGGSYVKWYNNDQKDSLLFTGNTFTIDSIIQDTTLYVQSVVTMGSNFECPGPLTPVAALIETIQPATIFGLSAGYLETDAAVQVMAVPANGTFSGRGISTDGNGNTWFSPINAGAKDSIAITYRYTTDAGCSADTVFYVSVLHNPGIGITELNDNRLLFYPNPANNTVTVVLPNNSYSTLLLFDASGKQILSVDLTSANSRYQMDVSGLSKGIYLLRLDGAKGSQFGKLSKL